METTLGILKPDCMRRHLMGAVIKRLEEAGFEVVDGRIERLSRDKAEQFYAVHRERPFFNDLIDFMTTGPVFVMKLQRDNAVEKLREVIGATDPAEAAPGTVRKDFATSKQDNVIHASDSSENAEKELAFFF